LSLARPFKAGTITQSNARRVATLEMFD